MDIKVLAELFLKLLTSIMIYIILGPPILLISALFLIFRLIVHTILKSQFGSTFGGVLSGIEAFFAIQVRFNNVVSILLIVKSKENFEDFLEKYKQRLKEVILEDPNQFSKFLCTRHRAFGFHYLKKNKLEIEKHFSILKIKSEINPISRDKLLSYLDHRLSDPLPYDGTGMWDVLVCENPVKSIKSGSGEMSYAVFTRIHHSVGDGVALTKCFTKMLSDFDSTEIEEKLLKQSKNWFVNIMDYAVLILMAPVSVLLQRFFTKQDCNSLHSFSTVSSKNHIVTKVEESRECIKIINTLKKNSKKATFYDIVVAATSRSFSDYFKKSKVDSDLTNFTIAVTKANFNSNNRDSNKVENNFSFPTITVPITFTQNDYCSQKIFMETLELVKKESERLRKKFYDVKALDAFSDFVCYAFPDWAFLPMLGFPRMTVMMTNMPGFSSVTILNGCQVEDMVYWVPVSEAIGVSLGIFSYDGRLQISLIVNKALIPEREDAQSLVDGIHRALIEMDSQV